MTNPFTGIISTEFKAIYVNMIGSLLEDDALTVPCTLIYGDTKWTDCSNCIFNASTGKSSNRYQTGGPAPFNHGVCSICNGLGKIAVNSTDSVYLLPIYDSKQWISWAGANSIDPKTPQMFVQTLSKLSETLINIKKAKEIIIDTTLTDYTRNHYQRYGEPGPIGFGDSSFVVTMWKKIG